MNRTILTVGLLVVGAVGGGVGYHLWLFGLGRGGGEPAAPPAATVESPPIRVVVAVPVRKALRRTSVQPGQIQAFAQTPLFVKFPGYVQKTYADIGDRVKQDEPLADLSIPELQDEFRQKEAMVTHAKAGVQQATTAVSAAEKAIETAAAGIREAQAGTIRAKGKYERWKSEHARTVELATSQSIERKLVDETRSELSSAEAGVTEAAAKVAAAEASLAERKVGVEKAKADLAVAQASVGNAEADLARTKSLLTYTQVRMPYVGVVVERNVDRGDFVQPASTATAKPLFVVAQSDTVRIFVDVPEMDAAQIELGAKAFIHVQSLPGRTIEGTVTRTSWALGVNRTLRTELDIPNPKNILRPGMYASAEIVLEERSNVLALPSTAIFTIEKQAFCCCVESDKIVRKPITVGMRTAQEVEAIDGLTGKEAVVQAQPASLQAGQRVEVTRP